MVHCKLKGKHIISQTNALNQEAHSYKEEDEGPHRQIGIFAEFLQKQRLPETIFEPRFQKHPVQYVKNTSCAAEDE